MNKFEVYFKWMYACVWDTPVTEEKENIVQEIQEAEPIQELPPKSKSYFTIDEMVASPTAKKLKIDNTPSEEVKKHLQELIDFMNPLREAWGSGIRISSGYRCKKLNSAVNGSPTSVHQIGYACDTSPMNGKMKEYKKFVQNYLKDKKFDQCLIEKSGSTEWVHIGLYNNAHQQRKQIKFMTV